MSQHIVVQEDKKFVFGWDPPLMSFFLQVHDMTIENKDEQIVVWLGADSRTRMYTVLELHKAARKEGLYIDYQTRVKLQGEKDDGR